MKTGGESKQAAKAGRSFARYGAVWPVAGRFVLLAPALWLACLAPPGRAETADDENGVVFSEDAMQDAQHTGSNAPASQPAEEPGTAATDSQLQEEATGRLFQSPGQSRFQYQSQTPAEAAPDDATGTQHSYPADEGSPAASAAEVPQAEEPPDSTASTPPEEPATNPPATGPEAHRPVPERAARQATPVVVPAQEQGAAVTPSTTPAPIPFTVPAALPAVTRQAVSVRDNGHALFLPGDAATGLAAFRSGADLVVVVDRPLAAPAEAPAGAASTKGQAGPLAALQVVGLENATVIRVPFPAAALPGMASAKGTQQSAVPEGMSGAAPGAVAGGVTASLPGSALEYLPPGQALPPLGFVHDGTGWLVCLGGACQPEPSGAVPTQAQHPAVPAIASVPASTLDSGSALGSGPGLLRLPGFVLFTGLGSGPVLRLPDPASGGTVFVALSTRLTGPVLHGAEAVGYRLRPSWQGLAVMADSSRVSLRSTIYGPAVESIAPDPLPVGLVPQGVAAGGASTPLHGGVAHGRDWDWLGLRDEPAPLLMQRWQAARAALKASGWASEAGRDSAKTQNRQQGGKKAAKKAGAHTSHHPGSHTGGKHTGSHAGGDTRSDTGAHTGGRHGVQAGEGAQAGALVPWPVRVAAARAAFAAGEARQSWLLLRDLPSSSVLGGVPEGVAVFGREPVYGLPAPHAGGSARDSAMVLRACAALLAGVPAEAGLLADADIRFGPDMALWRALYDMMTGADSDQTATLLARSYARLSQYPAPVRDRLAPRVAAYVARYGAPETLTSLRATLRDAPPDDSALALARALLDRQQGQTDAALVALDTLQAGTSSTADMAAVELIDLRLALHQITPAMAMSAYERLLAPERTHAGEQAATASGSVSAAAPAGLAPPGAPLPAQPHATARAAARLGYAQALVLAGQAGAAASVLSGLEPGEATPRDRLRDVWRQVLYTLVFGTVPQEAGEQTAPPEHVGFAPGADALAWVATSIHWLDYDAATAKLLAGYGAALVRAGRATQAVPVLAQAEFLSITPAMRADRAELLARTAFAAGQQGIAAQALERAALSGFSFGMPADFPADLPARLRYDNALLALAGGHEAQALKLLATDESDDGLRLRGQVYEQQRQWAQAVLVLGRLASRALPAEGALTPDQVALARRLAQDAAAAGDTDTLSRLRAWVGTRAPLPAGL
ncbi:MAG: hypothetical protein ABF888_08060 [Acetobacter papayae]